MDDRHDPGVLAALAPLPVGKEPLAPLADDPPLADRGMRFVAKLIDTCASVGGLFLAMFAALAFDEVSEGVLVVLMSLAGTLFLGVTAVQWTYLASRGQTLGKMAVGIRIVDAEGRNPGFVRNVLIRGGSAVLMGQVPIVGGILSLIDILMIYRHDRRTWHDQIAGTFVVVA